MNKSLTLLAFSFLVLCFACKKKTKELTNVNEDIPYSEEIEFPFGSGTGIPLLIGIPVTFDTVLLTNYQTYLAQYNTSASKVIHVKMKSLSMQVTAPPTQNLDFIDTVRVYVFGPNLPLKLVAYKYPVPNGIQTVVMDVVDENIKDYFLQDTLHVRLTGFINALPGGGTKVKLNTEFNLLANPLN
jgi:hypothetical protein